MKLRREWGSQATWNAAHPKRLNPAGELIASMMALANFRPMVHLPRTIEDLHSGMGVPAGAFAALYKPDPKRCVAAKIILAAVEKYQRR